MNRGEFCYLLHYAFRSRTEDQGSPRSSGSRPSAKNWPKLAPPAFIEFWLYDHSALNDRILFSRTYNPWAKGEKPRYVP
jgi:hypothetical protein